MPNNPSPPSIATATATPIITTPQQPPSQSQQQQQQQQQQWHDKSSAPPTTLLPTCLASTYFALHTACTLGVYAGRFEKLVDDPVNELAARLPVQVLAQVVFAVLCLRPGGAGAGAVTGGGGELGGASGSGSSSSSSSSRSKGGRRRGGAGAGGAGGITGSGNTATNGYVGWKRVIPALLSLTLTATLATPIFAILLVLFGAPFTTHHMQTLLCAAHMAILASTGMVYVHGLDGAVWKEVWGIRRPGDVVDRPWQAYPITILTGAYLGWAVGMILGMTVLFGKRIRFVEEEGLAGTVADANAKVEEVKKVE
ncbi:hypothetical protein BO70DRAFT_354557 [Aspergillus heteromorphus CBS 117.55]|uniref:Uncharacterized protein n=1 Tax=Aspergillus heteromorphus CBS 117.55 TaxID=1448321 RepID=A0A317VL22_9EURO|nr:uncharacterized protein BO70DRAFT_354557 [Aspergillus heteromorphus CBS 117.55]PWY75084.1 hypothetical protein BO70DRAFT_354557 [Aspergillus heteromorphus CBS 117.55]